MAILKTVDCSKGLNADLTPEELQAGAWSSVTNMRFVNGYAQRFNGTARVFDVPTITPHFIAPYQTPTKRYWIHAGIEKAFADDGTTRTEITPASLYTGAVDDRWSAVTFGGVFIANNGVQVPQFWNGDTGTNLANLTNWDANDRCASIHAFKNHLVALNITKTATNYPHMVKWSTPAVPGALPDSWDETDLTKDAGEQDLAQTPDLLIDAMQLGDSLIIYKERSMYRMNYVGAPYIFQFQRIPGESGMLFRGCGAEIPLGHVVLTAGDVVLNNGQGVVSIADGQVRKYIFNNISTTNYKKAFVTTNPQKNEVLVCFPFEGSTYCDKAAVWNWELKTWGLRDLNDATFGAPGQIENISAGTWASDSESWMLDSTTWNENEYSPNEARLLLSESTRISAFDVSSGDDGVTPLPGTLERVGMTPESAC